MIKVPLHEAVAAFCWPVDRMAWRVLTTLKFRCLQGCSGIGPGVSGRQPVKRHLCGVHSSVKYSLNVATGFCSGGSCSFRLSQNRLNFLLDGGLDGAMGGVFGIIEKGINTPLRTKKA